MPTLQYEVLDVFTDVAFGGNPLAVVYDADDLSTGAMQSLAREFHLSETAFPVRPTEPGADYRLRIFTPERELPFAGHPSVGAAWALSQLGRVAPGRVVQQCGAGLLSLDIAADRVTLTGGKPTVGDALDPAPLLAAVGLGPDDFAGAAPRLAGAGLDFLYLGVHDDAVARAVCDVAALRGLTGTDERAGVALGGMSVFAVDGIRVHARVFAWEAGVAEDPATGSAALGLGAWLVANGLAGADGESSYVVSQGAELHRPSRLDCVVRAHQGAATEVRVSGGVVPIARGEIARPPGA